MQPELAAGHPALLKSCSALSAYQQMILPSPGSAEAMESGDVFQARFSPAAVIYKLTWWGTGECRPAVPEPCCLLLAWKLWHLSHSTQGQC